jgi:hypothetical protein
MGILASWKWKLREQKYQRKRKRSIADARKYREKKEQRELILEWYKLLKPFQKRPYGSWDDDPLMALADDLSENAISNIVIWFILFGGLWTGIFVLLYLFEHGGWGQRLGYIGIWLIGYIVIIALSFHYTKDDMRIRLENYAEGWWVANDPVTGKEIYPLIVCPECKKKYHQDHYLRYLEPCEHCGHNIDWEAAKQTNN